MYRLAIVTGLSVLLLAGCTLYKPEQPAYNGIGGMTKWNTTPSDYLFHYETGFTGVDALGYDEYLQTAWSRLGAAQTCGVNFETQNMISKLISQYGETAITHELNGIGFHSIQSKRVPGFCDKPRIRDIKKALSQYSKDYFN